MRGRPPRGSSLFFSFRRAGDLGEDEVAAAAAAPPLKPRVVGRRRPPKGRSGPCVYSVRSSRRGRMARSPLERHRSRPRCRCPCSDRFGEKHVCDIHTS